MHASAAGTKMLSRAFAPASLGSRSEEASKLLTSSSSHRKSSGSRSAACALSDSFSDHGEECKVPSSDALELVQHNLKGSKLADTPEVGYTVEEAQVGKVECNGRGCRPFTASRTALYHSKSDTRDRAHRWSKPDFHLDFAHYLDEVWMETAAAEKHFSAALEADERDAGLLSAYAQFSWRSQSDADKAERLFSQALELAPQDPHILSSYAHFLWQTDS